MSDSPVTVLIADDNDAFRGGLRELLSVQPGITVVGEATNGQDALGLAAQLDPDVVVMDLQMPALNGIEATRRLVASRPHIGVLVLTMFEDDDSVFAAMRAGARGYLLKGARRAETVRAITAVAAGEAIFSPVIARRMMGFFKAARTAATIFPDLTDREREVLSRIAQGDPNEAIAAEFGLSLKTVRNHVSAILSKLQVADRAQAALRAREAGMG
ncbi:MAG TPA: response regulator transcription factor [Tepidiformaceae bacterium]|nr:response regulator transcription factor [Tepidiformaceae bacterium]